MCEAAPQLEILKLSEPEALQSRRQVQDDRRIDSGQARMTEGKAWIPDRAGNDIYGY